MFKKRKLISIMLTVSMMLTLFPFAAFADDTAVAKIGNQEYSTLADAISAANGTEGQENVTVTIVKSGEYAPFTITRKNVTVETAKDVKATIKVENNATNDSKPGEAMKITATGATLKGLDFVTANGSIIFNYYFHDQLTVENCSFTNTSGKVEGTTAMYVHEPSTTVKNCTFTNWERGYYTCGDNHAAKAIVFTDNTFNNVKVPFDGYWGKPAEGDGNNIVFTGNTVNPGSWGTSYIQVWDYAQYQYWLNGEESALNPNGESALKANLSGNTYNGDVVVYKTHCDWFAESTVTTDDTAKVVKRSLVVLDGLSKDESATVTHKDGSAITAFNEQSKSSYRGDKQVIYALSEGEYTLNVTQKIGESGTAVVTPMDLTVKAPEVGESNTQELKIPALPEDSKNVAQVGDQTYTSLQEAVEAAKNGGTVKLLQNVTIDEWTQVWNAKNLTIDGNGKTLTVKKISSNGNGDYLFYGAENLNVSDLIVNLPDGDRGFDMVSGKLEKVTVNGGVYAVVTGKAPEGQRIEIKNCTFSDQSDSAIYTQENGLAADTVIDGCTFNSDRAMILRNNEQFTNNTVKGASGVTIDDSATATVTGNTFTEGSRLKLYNTDSDIAQNKLLGNVVLDSTVPTQDSKISLNENYWGENRTPASVLGEEAAKKVDGGNTTYYEADTMQPEDLNTYQPPVVVTRYDVTVSGADNGTVTADKASASKGSTVTLTVTPDEGYAVDAITVTDKSGKTVAVTDKGNGKYTFTMPASDVTVKATFVKGDAPSGLPFTDVHENDWYYGPVEYVFANGIMNGTGDGSTFSPNVPLNRAMIAAVLYNLEGGPAVDNDGAFTDVPSGEWYTDAVNWAASEGIVGGIGDGLYAPNDNLTREQMASVLYRYAQYKGIDTSARADLTAFVDGSTVSPWASEVVQWAVAEKLINGAAGNTLQPQGIASRAQVATVFMNFCENVAK